MDMLRIYGDFQQIDEQGRVDLGPTPETWPGNRIADQLRNGLHILVDDGEREAEGVLEFDGEYWVARIVPGTGNKTTREKAQKPRG